MNATARRRSPERQASKKRILDRKPDCRCPCFEARINTGFRENFGQMLAF
jgi:hypothetical protein